MAKFRTKGSGVKKFIAVLLVVGLIASAVVWAIGSKGFKQNNPLKFFNCWGAATVSSNQNDGNGGTQNGGTITTDTRHGNTDLTEGDNNGISLYSAQLPRAAFAANGIAESADSAYTIVAEVLPDYASDKTLDGSVSWLNSESEFAAGRDVTDYMTVDQISEGTFNLVCLQDFGEPVLLTVASRSNPEVFGICTVNYYQRVKSVDFAFTLDGETVTPNVENGVYKFDYTGAEKDYVAEVVPVYSNYTIADETLTTSISGALTSDFGYTAAASLNTVKIPAGLTGGDPEMTENALNWCEYLYTQVFGITYNVEYVSIGRGLCLGETQFVHGNSIKPTYILTAEEKQHPRCAYYISLLNDSGNFVNETVFNQTKIRYENYQPSPYSFYGATVAAYNDFVVAVNRCNANGAGIVEYTVKISGERTTCEAVLQLGYNGELKVNVQDITLSDTDIKI